MFLLIKVLFLHSLKVSNRKEFHGSKSGKINENKKIKCTT